MVLILGYQKNKKFDEGRLDNMYEEVYEKIIKYLEKNPGVFQTIVTNSRQPTYYNLYVSNGSIYVAMPKNTTNPTKINEKLNKNDFFKLYPLYLDFLKNNSFSYLNNKAKEITGRRVYWIGLFFELKKRGII